MDKVGILIVSKCLSSSAMIDAFQRSERYEPEFYVLERQVNPFNFERARVHRVLPDLDVGKVARFARRYKESLAFGLTDTEDFITAGGRDAVEAESGVPMICVTREFAVEKSKADQRLLFERLFPDANPRYRVFDPKGHTDSREAVRELKRFAGEIGAPVIKPDAPARGAGVGVWGSDFDTEEAMVRFFRSLYSEGRVVVEEKVEGEESSFHAFSDGRHFVVAPQTRDYKRALDGNQGRLTGGMGSYRSSEYNLPFLRPSEWEHVVETEKKGFRRWKGRGSSPGLRGIVLYDAMMHRGSGFKVLERNSRGGNTEQINLLTTMQDDFVSVCYRMVDGTLKGVRFTREASVVTCAVPPDYGLGEPQLRGGRRRPSSSSGAPPPSLHPAPVAAAAQEIDLRRAYDLREASHGRLRIFPMDVRLEGGRCYLGTSRSVAVVGIGETIEEARSMSLAGVRAIDGGLRHRGDIGSRADLRTSAMHMGRLRAGRSPRR